MTYTDMQVIHYTTTDAIIGVIGGIGVIAAAVTLGYAFVRNRTSDGRYQ